MFFVKFCNSKCEAVDDFSGQMTILDTNGQTFSMQNGDILNLCEYHSWIFIQP